ncbi:hypothetical protein MC7420_5738 [Coleofasciculus chthonoplastes PCC 7420]|uniref:Uncharacterized protein n=1 Tax=Coleofasciculus chthonoplastes PCC 7420 TaxID=118168 RepID=B4VVR9_9CYAN|nr:hypothetical protein [Coleofasciculus chthonoplastes]EDX73858.1 hypothetical protein MC7420_5738 [Coleofasciculus chthonoplastes PCC 7420]
MRRHFGFKIGFFSGSEFNVAPSAGLNGYCDYILTASPDSYEIRTPVLTLVEAKNENIKSVLAQCIAEMIAAQLFNQSNEEPRESIYGAVTTGTEWKFLELRDQTVFIDKRDYFISEVSRILAVLAFTDVADKMNFTIEDAVSLGGCLLDVLKDDIKNQSCSERTRLETHEFRSISDF